MQQGGDEHYKFNYQFGMQIMATWYYLYETANGRLVSETSLLPVDPPAHLTVKTYTERKSQSGLIWNPVTLDFEAGPYRRMIDKLDFIELFIDAELEGIITSPNSKVKVFIKKLELANSVDLKSDRMTDSLAGLETLGLIAAGRAVEIGNG